jgi:hypothetical protein
VEKRRVEWGGTSCSRVASPPLAFSASAAAASGGHGFSAALAFCRIKLLCSVKQPCTTQQHCGS